MWLIIVEAVLISLLLFNIYRIIRRYRSLLKDEYAHPIERLSAAISVVFGKGKFLSIVMTDIKIVYYAFIAKKSVLNNETQFSYTKASMFNIIAIPVFIIVVIESSVIHVLIDHFLINKFDNIGLKFIPWIIHLLNVYGVVLCTAQIRAIKLLPHTVEDESVTINFGILGRINIPYSEIEKVEKPNENMLGLKEDKQTFYAKISLDTPQILITLKKDMPVHLLYGRTNLVNKVISVADDEHRFRTAIKNKITSME